jgi:hypothetical protein
MQIDEVLDDVLISFYEELGCAGPIHIVNSMEVKVNG